MSDWQADRDERNKAIDALLDSLGLTIRTPFTPWSQSRSYKPGNKFADLSLNWIVSVLRKGLLVLETPYTAGIAHCPSYKATAFLSVNYVATIKQEVETGRAATFRRTPITLDRRDVFYSLIMDASAIDYATYEAWARDTDSDPDSRSGEATYRVCLQLGLSLRAAIGDAALLALRDAYQDY